MIGSHVFFRVLVGRSVGWVVFLLGCVLRGVAFHKTRGGVSSSYTSVSMGRFVDVVQIK